MATARTALRRRSVGAAAAFRSASLIIRRATVRSIDVTLHSVPPDLPVAVDRHPLEDTYLTVARHELLPQQGSSRPSHYKVNDRFGLSVPDPWSRSAR